MFVGWDLCVGFWGCRCLVCFDEFVIGFVLVVMVIVVWVDFCGVFIFLRVSLGRGWCCNIEVLCKGVFLVWVW